MPISDADILTVRRFYAARDLSSMESCFAPEAVWHFPGEECGRRRSQRPAIRDAIRDFQARIGPLSGGTFRGELLDVAVGEHYIVAVQHGSAQHEGRKFDVTARQLMRVEAG
jgi:ketosteroid isomerase-like protein